MSSVDGPILDVAERGNFMVIIALGLVVIQIIIGVVIYYSFDTWEARASFGDMFGVVTTLFSALALAGVVYTVVLQRHELALQRQELELTRRELERAADAQRESAELLRVQVKLMMNQAAESRARERREAAPLFQYASGPGGAGKVELGLLNRGATIRELTAKPQGPYSVRLQPVDVLQTNGSLQVLLEYDSSVKAPTSYAFDITFTDLYGSRRIVTVSHNRETQAVSTVENEVASEPTRVPC